MVDKPRGPTSFDVVATVRRALEVDRAGHTGTLDPLATGVLPVCVGEATRIAQFLTTEEKTYVATVALGAATDTLDAAGRIVLERPVPPFGAVELERALEPLRGTYLQTPPMYSAVRVNGERLYEKARRGEEVDRAPREVTVHALEVLSVDPQTVVLRVRASKGFFVRVLAASLGEGLGTCAHLSALRRVASGLFTESAAIPLAEVLARPAAAVEQLLSEGHALAWMPALVVDADEARRVRSGGLVERPAAPGLVRVMDRQGTLLAVAEREGGRLRYRRVLSEAHTRSSAESAAAEP